MFLVTFSWLYKNIVNKVVERELHPDVAVYINPNLNRDKKDMESKPAM